MTTLAKIPRPIRDRLVTMLSDIKCKYYADRVLRATEVWGTLSTKERLSYLHTVHMAYLAELTELAVVMHKTASNKE